MTARAFQDLQENTKDSDLETSAMIYMFYIYI